MFQVFEFGKVFRATPHGIALFTAVARRSALAIQAPPKICAGSGCLDTRLHDQTACLRPTA